ncbi:hypothetical protein [Amycolatopsis sp. EV170708-02-1]|uniref:hypothetical protein n=1 Tax=Amycolatopsis sp. EV170708-02-1 TaxID=2919322 RepID=UPI001F0BC862|nr:hypothetical protein [Amycolatopsis sp. EV170708-02-1]UMP06776.1 hypothetical protein MJQ72_19060 [Amycolatopsis sp. EV170708-02-1]
MTYWSISTLTRACAQALAGLTPVDRMLPDLADPELTHRVARAVTEALRPRRGVAAKTRGG